MVALSDLTPKGRRQLRNAAIFIVGSVSLGSLSGAALARYTVAGMDPFYRYARTASYDAASRDRENRDWGVRYDENLQRAVVVDTPDVRDDRISDTYYY
ncbi:hypothetical protein [Stakelama tenebrarum]|uniref:Uncharacterized protein n=1 Tax=Stakelama tenebrarum TaxID=2711215 RepID=A0A6G6Y232_9SPHN|nr:hypothetical protein [Sphingosinithalassobacter tenebrarum]QIG79004.1 hypothetical protein G5C33_03865 [Sphingosinithalassobacter tenebrarum]